MKIGELALVWMERTVQNPATSGGTPDALNLIFIVALALVITLLARRLAGKNNKPKK